MKVSYNDSLDDTVALQEAQLRNLRETGKLAAPLKGWLVLLLMIGVVIIIFWVLFKDPPELLVGIAIPVALYAWAMRSSKTKQSLRTGLAKMHPEGEWRPNITEINDSGITSICMDNIVVMWWRQIVQVQREDDYLRFYTDQGSITQVPLRVFRTPQDLDRFEAEAIHLWQAHKDDPPISFPEISGIIEDESNIPGCILINPAQSASPNESP